MTEERWLRVKALFESAVERPDGDREAFLQEATAGDSTLRREVESLLASDATDGSILQPVRDVRRTLLANLPPIAPVTLGGAGPPPVTVHSRIGPYTVVHLLGVGGMGEVYRAHDAKLNRDVALKVLPSAFALDPDRLARFRREAHMLAALNHANIAAIYGFEDSSDLHALVLELVEGPTLADRIANGPLPLREALPIARQIVDAIEAAHERGIVHRDLKPANIKLDPGGTVKVLDFGLAKAANLDDAPPDLIASHAGLILGTASYMSPEQARGQNVDKRTDIWAFGCVLFEMLTGRLTFAGGTVSDTIAKVLEREPDWAALPAATPAAIRHLLERCFVKDPRQRIRDIGEVRIQLDAPDAAALGDVTPGQRGSSGGWSPWLALATLALVVGAWELWRDRGTLDNPLADATFTPFTNWEGNEEGGEISPNGELVAFLSDRDGEFDLWVSQVGTETFENLTSNIAPLAPSGSIVRKLGFSADGSQIWFNPGDGKPPAIMPWTGATHKPFLESGTNTPAWSPDGKAVVYVDKANRDDPIYLADASGGDKRQILGPGTLKNMNPVWSPDSKWIYFGRGSEPQDETEIDVWRLRPSGGPPERITTQHLAINFLAPLDLRSFLYVARAEDRSGPWLWSLDVETGRSTRVQSGVAQYMSVSTSRNGRRIVATVANPSASLWSVPLRGAVVEESEARPYSVPSPTGFASAPRFGHDSMFYLSERGTGDGLWRVQGGQPLQVRRSVDGAVSEPPAVSSKGRLAIVVRRQGKRHLSVMSADGTNAQTLAPSVEIDGAAGQGAADWSPDGTRIVTGGRDAQGSALFIIPVETGVPLRLLEGQWVNPVWSPRGDLILYAGRSVIGQVELRGVRPDGTAFPLPQVFVRPGGYRFTPDGSAVVYLERIQSPDFSLLDLATGRSRQLTRLAKIGAVRTFDIPPDGKSIVFDRSRQNSNIVLIERTGR